MSKPRPSLSRWAPIALGAANGLAYLAIDVIPAIGTLRWWAAVCAPKPECGRDMWWRFAEGAAFGAALALLLAVSVAVLVAWLMRWWRGAEAAGPMPRWAAAVAGTLWLLMIWSKVQ